MNIRDLIWQVFVIRWCRSIAALTRGTKVHPAAALVGGPSRIRLGRGTSIGARSRLVQRDPGEIELRSAVWVSSDVEIQTDSCIRIGGGTTIQRRCSIIGTVRIGRDCIFAPNVFIASGTHPFRAYPELPIRDQERILFRDFKSGTLDKPVWIQEDVWLGVNVVVCPGVTIGKGSVVGANAVVTHDVPPYTVVAGVPANVIGKRLDWDPPARVDADRPEHKRYFLDGCSSPDQEADSAGMLVCSGDSLFVAVGRYGPTVCVQYSAVGESTINVMGQSFAVSDGDGTIEIELTRPQERAGPLTLEISAQREKAGTKFKVLRVMCEPLGMPVAQPVS